MLLRRLLAAEPSVRLINCTQQFAERWRFLNRPCTVEGRAKHIHIATRKQSYSYDAFMGHKTLRKLIHVSLNAPKPLKCPAFRQSIG